MAEKLQIVIDAENRATPALAQVESRLRSMTGATSFLASSGFVPLAVGIGGAVLAFRALSGAASAAISAVEGIASATFGAVKAAADEETGILRLGAVIEQTGTRFSRVRQDVEAFASAQQRQAGIADEETRRSLAQLIGMTGRYQGSLETLALAQDVAAGSGQGMETVLRVVARATLGEVEGLSRVVPALASVTEEKLKFISAGERSELILGVLRAAYQDQARTLDPFSRGVEFLRNSLGDLREAIGKVISGHGAWGVAAKAIGDVIQLLVGVVNSSTGALVEWVDRGVVFVLRALRDLAPKLGQLLVVFGKDSLEAAEIASKAFTTLDDAIFAISGAAQDARTALEVLSGGNEDAADTTNKVEAAMTRLNAAMERNARIAAAAAAAPKIEAERQKQMEAAVRAIADRVEAEKEAALTRDSIGVDQLVKAIHREQLLLRASTARLEHQERLETQAAEQFSQTWGQTIQSVGQAMTQLLSAVLEEMTFAFVTGSDFSARAFAGNFLRAIGSIATQMGTMLLLTGLASSLIPGMQSAAGSIPFGLALIALGAALGGVGRAVAGGGGTAAGGGAAGAPAFGPAPAPAVAVGGGGGGGPRIVNITINSPLATRAEIGREVRSSIAEADRLR